MGQRLEDDSDETAATFVDDTLQALPQLLLCVVGHGEELVLDAVTHEMVQGLAENVGLPEFFGVSFELVNKIPDELLALLLGADDRGNFGLDIYPDYMKRRRCGA